MIVVWGYSTHSALKAAKYEIQKLSTCRATLFRRKFWSMFPVFHLAWSTWPTTKTFDAGWRSAARWLVDLPEREHICCATICEFDEKRATKPKFVAQSRPALYFSEQLSWPLPSALHHPRPQAFCTVLSFARIKRPRWRPVDTISRKNRGLWTAYRDLDEESTSFRA